jgi:hypothetical protein
VVRSLAIRSRRIACDHGTGVVRGRGGRDYPSRMDENDDLRPRYCPHIAANGDGLLVKEWLPRCRCVWSRRRYLDRINRGYRSVMGLYVAVSSAIGRWRRIDLV